jgi:hypothetical protein
MWLEPYPSLAIFGGFASSFKKGESCIAQNDRSSEAISVSWDVVHDEALSASVSAALARLVDTS